MYEVVEAQRSLRFRITSEPENVSLILREVREYCQACPPAETAKLHVALRELLNNALHHGNEGDPRRLIVCALGCTGNHRIRLRISDEGNGFDHSQLDLRLPTCVTRDRMRGLPLVYASVDELRFNDSGNEVAVEFDWRQRPCFCERLAGVPALNDCRIDPSGAC